MNFNKLPNETPTNSRTELQQTPERIDNFFDAVVHLRNGAYGLVEVKLGGDRLIAEGVANLEAFSGKIDTKTMKAPAFRMVVTAVGDYAYRRPADGIYVCPLTALRP